MGYMKRLMFFSPPGKCFFEDALSDIIQKYRLRLCDRVLAGFD